MSLRDVLTLSGVTITLKTEDVDQYGDPTATSATATITAAAIWSPGQSDRYVSDRIAKTATHILAVEYGKVNFGQSVGTVTNGSNVYRLTGLPDNVMNRNELVLHGMEEIL